MGGKIFSFFSHFPFLQLMQVLQVIILCYHLLLMWIDPAFQLLLTAKKEGLFDDRNSLLLL